MSEKATRGFNSINQYESWVQVLKSLITQLDNIANSNIFEQNAFIFNMIEKLKYIIDDIIKIHLKKSISYEHFQFCNLLVNNLLLPFIEDVEDFNILITNLQEEIVYSDKNRFIEKCFKFDQKLANQISILQNINIKNYNTHFISEKYADERVITLESDKKQLEEDLKILKQSGVDKEIEIEIKNLELEKKQIQLANAEEEKEKIKNQLDLIEERKNKITNSFKVLENCLSPINDEHRRLRILFWIYAVLIALIFITLISIEVIICIKFHINDSFPDLGGYITLFLPIPLAGGLLWAFITQMNRAQRQLVVLSKHKHEVKYIEGLLLAINNLSPDINNSIQRVNTAIDRLLDNHLKKESNVDNYDEDSLLKEEKKDEIPLNEVMKTLKEIKELIKIKS